MMSKSEIYTHFECLIDIILKKNPYITNFLGVGLGLSYLDANYTKDDCIFDCTNYTYDYVDSNGVFGSIFIDVGSTYQLHNFFDSKKKSNFFMHGFVRFSYEQLLDGDFYHHEYNIINSNEDAEARVLKRFRMIRKILGILP